jgi:hypothetical protein
MLLTIKLASYEALVIGNESLWNSFKASYPHALDAGVYTPYALSADQEHQYLLHVTRSIQALIYYITLLIPSET